jgi:hypothetical protein
MAQDGISQPIKETKAPVKSGRALFVSSSASIRRDYWTTPHRGPTRQTVFARHTAPGYSPCKLLTCDRRRIVGKRICCMQMGRPAGLGLWAASVASRTMS